MTKTRKKIIWITEGAIVAALYVVITYFVSAFNLASGAIQVRLSDALCILPVFTPAAIPGLFAGCLLANLLTGCVVWDIVFGSLATLIGAIGTYYLKKTRFLCVIPPILSNAIIVPFVLKYAYDLDDAWWFLALTVGVGELIAIGICGTILRKSLRVSVFRSNEYSIEKKKS